MTTETFGCDFAWTKPDPTALRNAGYSFVLGYISNDPSKDLSGPQIAAYRAAGLYVGLVYETAANRVLSGASGGGADGAAAESACNSRGYPKDCPVFFAVDYDAQPGDYSTIDAYGRAFNAATNRPVGIYGSASLIDHFVTPGTQPYQYGWQTAAWSNGVLSAKANVYQRASHLHPLVVPGTQFDEDVITNPIPLFGGTITPPGAPIPVPTPPPVAPKPIYYRVQAGENLTVIANRFHTTVTLIATWSHIANPSVIYPGENVIVGWK